MPDKLNIYAKLMKVRQEFLAAGAKKTGRNLHAEFMYFELEDIVPIAESLFEKYGLIMLTTFNTETAAAQIINMDDANEEILFKIPFIQIAEPAKFRMNEVQGMGAAVTYYRRYLYMLVLDLVESDTFDAQDGTNNTKPVAQAKKSKPVTAEERKELKKELVATENVAASEEQIKDLKTQLNALVTADPTQEEFIQSIAVETQGFKKLSSAQYETLSAAVNAMIAEVVKA